MNDGVSETDLIHAAKNGDPEAYGILSEKYEPLISSMSDKFIPSMPDAGIDDLKQEARVAFYRALMSYDESQSGVTFGLYAKICIRNRMISLFRKNSSHSTRRIAKELPQAPVRERITDRSEIDSIAAHLLTDYEKNVFYMYLGGKSYEDIAKSVGKSVKSVDNALFRAKRKLRIGYGKV